MKSRTWARSIWVLSAFLLSAFYVSFQAFSERDGFSGQTLKNPGTPGCNCHCPQQNMNNDVTVTISGPAVVQVGQSANYTATVTSSNANYLSAGIDIAADGGTVGPNGVEVHIKDASGDVVHSAPLAMNGGSATFNFKFTAPAQSGPATIYATGLATNNDDDNDEGQCIDNWNHAANFSVSVIDPPSNGSLTFTPVGKMDFGPVRVNSQSSQIVHICNTGSAAVDIANAFILNGINFSLTQPINQTLAPNECIERTIIYAPRRHEIKQQDSLILVNNSSNQRAGILLQGTGVQAVWSFAPPTIGNTVEFDAHDIGTVTEQTYFFQNTGDDTLFIDNLLAAGDAFSLGYKPTVVLPGAMDSIQIFFAPTSSGTHYVGRLVIGARNMIPNSTIPEVLLSGSSTGLGNPTRIPFGDVLAGSFADSCFETPANPLSTPITVTAQLLGPGFAFQGTTFPMTINPGEKGTICVRFSPTEARTYLATLTVTATGNGAPLGAFILDGRGRSGTANTDIDTLFLGSTKINSNLNGNVLLRNVGNGNLQVNNVVFTPNTNSEFALGANLPSSIAMDDSANITIKYRPTSAGCDTTTMLILTSDQTHTTQVVVIGCGQQSSITTSHSDTVDFGTFRLHGSAAFQSVQITNEGSEQVLIDKNELTGDPSFSINGTAPTFLNGFQVGTWNLQFNPTTVGKKSAMLVIAGDGGAFVDTFYLVGEGVETALEHIGSYDFGEQQVFSTTKARITMHNTDNTNDITVYKYDMVGPDAFRNFRFVDTTQHTFKKNTFDSSLRIAFVPSEVRKYSAQVIVYTNDPGVVGGRHIINLRGTGVAGKLLFGKSTYDFGKVALNNCLTKKITVYNIGSGTMGVHINPEFNPSTSPFSYVSGIPFDVAPDEQGKGLYVKFCPTANGVTSAVMSVSANGHAYTVNLTGEGVPFAGVRPLELARSGWDMTVSPNPVRNTTTLRMKVDRAAHASIQIFDVTGRVVSTLTDRQFAPGAYEFRLNASGMAAGHYFARVMSGATPVAQAKIIVTH